MSARTCIAVDSSCDLPAQFIKQHNIEILPIYIRHASGRQMDYRNTKSMLNFYQNHSRQQFGLAQSEPLSVDEMTGILQQRLLPKYDLVQVVTVNSKKSELFKRVSEAAMINEPKFRAMEKAEPGRQPFRIRLYDSMSMFTGHALLVYELVKRIKIQQMPINRSIRAIDAMREEVYGYIVPNDLSYMRDRRHLRKADNNISWINFKLASLLNLRPIVQLHKGDTKKIDTGKGFWGAVEKLFEHTRRQIQQGLTSDVIAMSYGGVLDEIRDDPRMVAFRDYCRQHNIKTMLSMMSMTGTVNVGPRAFTLSFATDKELVTA
ncbi:DegV family protein [Marinimicrobium sp. ABcell2]|uniref:DegV family protein n=1 Tax=Marinimicrobium sp. ABcell2 TaxID=3069751 RepID=UPI0027B6EF23|nr:DegV family protein [Marinimicrobium sp. ABcell2]MDQ2076290.1 DegV family protein [Marinimicrobium sp. ABcell2]